ncbi:MAG: hypothetical protein O7D94_02260 [Planctomycetota bacterium]|nr:hypothetical protein [Planctomycetota bacterium]
MLSGFFQQILDAISGALPAPIGDLLGQFFSLFVGLFASFGL